MRASKTAVTDSSVWQYYETAANLGDTGESKPTCLIGLADDVLRAQEADTSPYSDAMNEVAWCYLEGFGCKKDKVSLSRPSVASRFSSQTYEPCQHRWWPKDLSLMAAADATCASCCTPCRIRIQFVRFSLGIKKAPALWSRLGPCSKARSHHLVQFLDLQTHAKSHEADHYDLVVFGRQVLPFGREER